MKTVNRSVLVLRHRDPFRRWVARVFPDEAVPDLLRGQTTSVYLVPPDPEEKKESAPIDSLIPVIFEHELESWCTDRALWPTKRDRATFEAWFEITVESIVYDLGRGTLRAEEY